MLPIAAAGWFVIPYLIEYFFPKYIESIWPIRLLMIGFLFSTRQMTKGFLITIKAYKVALALDIYDLIVFIVCPIAVISCFDMPLLSALSIGLSVAYFITYYTNIIVTRTTIFNEKYNSNSINS